MLRNEQTTEDWRTARDPSFSQELFRFPNSHGQHRVQSHYPSPSKESWRNVGYRPSPPERQQIQLNCWADQSQSQLGSWNRVALGERLISSPIEQRSYTSYNTHRDEDWMRSRDFSVGRERSDSPSRRFLYDRSHMDADWMIDKHVKTPKDNEVISLLNPTGKSIQEFEDEELEKAAQVQIAMMAELEKKAVCRDLEESNPVETISSKVIEFTKKEIEDVEDKLQQTKRDVESTGDNFIHSSEDFMAEIGFERGDSMHHPPASEMKDDKPKVVADAKFEDIHFFHLKGRKQDVVPLTGPSRRKGTLVPYSGDSWAEQYKSQVNRRKMEIHGGNISTLYPSHVSANGRGTVFASVFLPRVGHTVCGMSTNVGTIPAHEEPIKYLKRNESMSDDRDYQDQWQQEDSHSQSYQETIIDPKEFVEDLSDSEDWNEVVALVNTPVSLKSPPKSLKRGAPSDHCGINERPLKRGLLGGPPFAVSPSPNVSRMNRSKLSNHPTTQQLHDVSFFRMDLPSVVPKGAFENPKNVRDDTNISPFDNVQGSYESNRGAMKIDTDDSNIRVMQGICPQQSRIAPAIPRGRRFLNDQECDTSSAGTGLRSQGFNRSSKLVGSFRGEAWHRRIYGPPDVGSFFR